MKNIGISITTGKLQRCHYATTYFDIDNSHADYKLGKPSSQHIVEPSDSHCIAPIKYVHAIPVGLLN